MATGLCFFQLWKEMLSSSEYLGRIHNYILGAMQLLIISVT